MALPNYFLADLPPESPLTPGLITEACQTLRRNRSRYLLSRSTDSVIQTIVDVARQWLAPSSPWRTQALDADPRTTGFSKEVLASGLQTYFRSLTTRNLNSLVLQEFGHSQRLDRLVANDAEALSGVSAHALGPELLVHLTSGILPTPVFTGIIHGFLVRSAQFVKCASGTSFLARLFAHSLREVEPKLAACLEVADWAGGNHPAEPALFAESDCVVAGGRDESLEALRTSLPPRTRFLARHHTVSAGYVAREALSPPDDQSTLSAVAADVADWDQMGPLAPHVFYVENGGLLPPERFAAELASELGRLESRLPRTQLDPATTAELIQRREFYRVRAAGSDATHCWFSPEPTAWSVVYESDARFQTSCLRRFILVKAVDTPDDCLRQAEMIRGRWSTVGLAAVGPRMTELAQQFADWGVHRVCPVGRMQHPPLTWRRDGRPPLGDLVRWTHHELPLDA